MEKFSSYPTQYESWNLLEKSFFNQEFKAIKEKYTEKESVYEKWVAVRKVDPNDAYVQKKCLSIEAEFITIRMEKTKLLNAIESVKGWVQYHEFNGMFFLKNINDSPYVFKTQNGVLGFNAPVSLCDISRDQDGAIILYKSSTGEPRFKKDDAYLEECLETNCDSCKNDWTDCENCSNCRKESANAFFSIINFIS